MRVISQCGKYDLPYEKFVFICERTMIYAVSVSGNGTKQWLVAQYETPEKAEKAMEMLHKTYTGIMPSLVINKNATFEALNNSTTGAWIKPAKQGDVEMHMLPRIFQFPADDEIEVEE